MQGISYAPRAQRSMKRTDKPRARARRSPTRHSFSTILHCIVHSRTHRYPERYPVSWPRRFASTPRDARPPVARTTAQTPRVETCHRCPTLTDRPPIHTHISCLHIHCTITICVRPNPSDSNMKYIADLSTQYIHAPHSTSCVACRDPPLRDAHGSHAMPAALPVVSVQNGNGATCALPEVFL